MKRFILIIIITLFFIPASLAKTMYQFNATVDINDDISNFRLDFKFSDDFKKVEIPFSGKISNLSYENGNCELKEEEIGQILSCEPSSPFIVGTIDISVNFKAEGLIEKRGNISLFSFDIPVLWSLDESYVTIKLPEKAALADKILLPISPIDVDTRLDGRRVIAKWHFDNKNYGDVIPIRIYYELITSPSIVENYSWIIILVIIIASIVIAIIYRIASLKKSELVFSVLNENEKNIIEIIKKEKKEKIDQRKIVSESGFSKAKVSRIIKNLEERGVVESERIGRKNRIKLKKTV